MVGDSAALTEIGWAAMGNRPTKPFGGTCFCGDDRFTKRSHQIPKDGPNGSLYLLADISSKRYHEGGSSSGLATFPPEGEGLFLTCALRTREHVLSDLKH